MIDTEFATTVGAGTLVGYEVVKRYAPNLLPDVKEEAKSGIFSLLFGAALKLAGSTLGWPTVIASSLVGLIGASLGHDKLVVPFLDKTLDKVPGQK